MEIQAEFPNSTTMGVARITEMDFPIAGEGDPTYGRVGWSVSSKIITLSDQKLQSFHLDG